MNDFQKFAKQHCANFHGQDRCHMEPDGGLTCVLFRSDRNQRCPVKCPGTEQSWFEAAVLPMDEALEARYLRQHTDSVESDLSVCSRCAKEYRKVSNSQKYCSDCKSVVRRESAKHSMRQKRSEART